MNSEGLLQLVVTADTANAVVAMDDLQGSTDELTGGLESSAGGLSEASDGADAAAAKIQGAADVITGSSAQIAEAGVAGGTGVADGMEIADQGVSSLQARLTGLIVNAGGAGVVLDGLSDDAAGASFSFDTLGGSIAKSLVPLLALFGLYEGIKDIVSDAVTEVNQWQSAQDQLNNTIKEGNNVTGLNINQLEALAEKTAAGTPITKSATLAAEASLITYKSLGSDIFPQVAAQLNNVATAMANTQGNAVASTTNIAQAAKKLGVAFQDPETGITRLKLAGIDFTAIQIAQVKAIQDGTNATKDQALAIKGVTSAGADQLANWSNLTAAQQTAAEATYGLTSVQIEQAEALGKNNGLVAAQQQLLNDLSGIVAGKAAASMETFQGKVDYVQKQIGEELVPTIQTLEKAFEDLGSALASAAVWIEKHHMLSEALIGSFVALGAVIIGGLVVWLGGLVASLLETAAAFTILNISMGVITIAALALGAVAALVIANWSDVKQWFDDFIGWLENHWELIAEILAGPFAPALLVALHFKTQLESIFKDAVNDIEGIWGGVTTFFSSLWTDIQNTFDNALSGSFWASEMDKWWQEIVTWFISLPGQVTQALNQDFWQPMSAWFSSIPAQISSQLSKWWTAIDAWFSALPARVSKDISTWWTALIASFTTLPTDFINSLTQSGKATTDNYTDGVTTEWKDAKTIAKISAAIIAALALVNVAIGLEIAKDGAEVGGKLMSGMVSGVGNNISAALSIGPKIISALNQATINADKWLYDVGVDVIQGLVDGMGSMVGVAVGSVEHIGSSIVHAISDILGRHSPSTVFAAIGEDVGQGLVNGITSMNTAAGTAAANLGKAVITGAGQPQVAASLATVANGRSENSGGAGTVNITIQAGTVVGANGAQALATLVWQQLQQISRANGFNGALPQIGVQPVGSV